MQRLHPALALLAFIALPMALAADTPPPKSIPATHAAGMTEPRLIHVTRIEHANARELDNELTKIFSIGPPPAGGPLMVVSDFDTNSLILSGPASLLEEAEMLVKKLDTAQSSAAVTQIVRLKHAKAKELAGILRDVVAQKIQTSRSGWVGIACDERTESLLLTGSPASLASLHTLIDGLDVESQRTAE